MSQSNTDQVTATPAILREQLSAYRKVRQRWTAIIENEKNDEERNRGHNALFNAEQRIIETVVALVGYEPREDWPISVIIDGLPITVLREDANFYAAIPGLDNVISFTRAD